MRDNGVGFVEYLPLFREQWRLLFSVEARTSAEDMAEEWQGWLGSCSIDPASIKALQKYGVKALGDLSTLSQSREDYNRAVSSLSSEQQSRLWRVLSGGDGVPAVGSVGPSHSTWEQSMQSMSRGHKEMMWLLCNFGVDDIPVDVVVASVTALPETSKLRKLIPGGGLGGVVAVSACEDVLRVLCERSLVKWMPSSPVSVHRLVQAAVWETSPPDERESLARACMTGLTNGLQSLVPEVRRDGLASAAATALRQWLRHADAVREKRAGMTALRDVMIGLAEAAASGWQALADLRHATRLYRLALDMTRQLHGADADHAAVATALSSLASLLEAQGEVTESAALRRESSAMAERLADPLQQTNDVV
jgi:hypothetical protein